MGEGTDGQKIFQGFCLPALKRCKLSGKTGEHIEKQNDCKNCIVAFTNNGGWHNMYAQAPKQTEGIQLFCENQRGFCVH